MRGYFSRAEFIDICRWKSQRSQKLVHQNSEAFIQEATSFALTAREERLRIGVSWPTASVFLHFGYDNIYPILDVRALSSLGVKVTGMYTFELWWQYAETCRQLASQASVSMRTLDRDPWQFSADQP